MFDASIDAWYVWIALAATSVVLYGLALALPAAPSPAAATVADEVDTVAVSEHGDTSTQSVAADEIRLGPHRVSLRGDGGVSHASFAYGPVTPVRADPLLAVVHGTSPADAFDDSASFERAVDRAQDRSPTWRSTDGEMRVRSVSWEGVDATLVAA